jgi:hypothetical protein
MVLHGMGSLHAYLSTIRHTATQSNLLTQDNINEQDLWRVVDADYLSAARMIHGEL